MLWGSIGFYQGSASGMKMSKGQIGRRLPGLAVAGVGLAGVTLATGGTAFAELGQPAPWEYKLQEAASPVMENITWFHNFLFVLITVITLFVLALLMIIVVKFNAKANPVPSKTTHNTLLEVAWTLIPVLILVGIAVPSFRLLFEELDVPKADLTIKATGNQWNWTYAYPDDKIEYTSIILSDEDRAKLDSPPPRLLGVDHALVVPLNKVVRVQTTGADVIHSFAVPAFGIKIDSVPGRLNETWFKATKPGVYYGQCSELCGKDHAFMPIVVKVVSDQEYDDWKKCVQSNKDDCIDQPQGTKVKQSVKGDGAAKS
jgi:cytochrome c oxidase subunit II